MAEGTKTCPRCAEEMPEAAQACRFCGHEFEAAGEATTLPPGPSAQPVPPSPPPSVAPPPPPPFTASRAGAERFDLGVRARQSLWYKRIVMTVEGDRVTLTGRRTDPGLVRMLSVLRIIFLAGYLLFIAAVLAFIVFAKDSISDTTGQVLVVVLLVASVVVILLAVALRVWYMAARKTRSAEYSETLGKAAIRSARNVYNWDLGCGLMILTGILPGLIIMLLIGRKTVIVQAPFDQSASKRGLWKLNARTADEAARVVYALTAR